MTTPNDHINVTKIDTYTNKEFGITSCEEMCKFQTWLDEQPTKIIFVKDALKLYRNPEVVDIVTTEAKTEKKIYKASDFKSRQQLNNFLRRNNYTWHKIAPMNEYEEDRYGESCRWQLYSEDDRTVTVSEALGEISV